MPTGISPAGELSDKNDYYASIKTINDFVDKVESDSASILGLMASYSLHSLTDQDFTSHMITYRAIWESYCNDYKALQELHLINSLEATQSAIPTCPNDTDRFSEAEIDSMLEAKKKTQERIDLILDSIKAKIEQYKKVYERFNKLLNNPESPNEETQSDESSESSMGKQEESCYESDGRASTPSLNRNDIDSLIGYVKLAHSEIRENFDETDNVRRTFKRLANTVIQDLESCNFENDNKKKIKKERIKNITAIVKRTYEFILHVRETVSQIPNYSEENIFAHQEAVFSGLSIFESKKANKKAARNLTPEKLNDLKKGQLFGFPALHSQEIISKILNPKLREAFEETQKTIIHFPVEFDEKDLHEFNTHVYPINHNSLKQELLQYKLKNISDEECAGIIKAQKENCIPIIMRLQNIALRDFILKNGDLVKVNNFNARVVTKLNDTDEIISSLMNYQLLYSRLSQEQMQKISHDQKFMILSGRISNDTVRNAFIKKYKRHPIPENAGTLIEKINNHSTTNKSVNNDFRNAVVDLLGDARFLKQTRDEIERFEIVKKIRSATFRNYLNDNVSIKLKPAARITINFINSPQFYTLDKTKFNELLFSFIQPCDKNQDELVEEVFSLIKEERELFLELKLNYSNLERRQELSKENLDITKHIESLQKFSRLMLNFDGLVRKWNTLNPLISNEQNASDLSAVDEAINIFVDFYLKANECLARNVINLVRNRKNEVEEILSSSNRLEQLKKKEECTHDVIMSSYENYCEQTKKLMEVLNYSFVEPCYSHLTIHAKDASEVEVIRAWKTKASEEYISLAEMIYDQNQNKKPTSKEKENPKQNPMLKATPKVNPKQKSKGKPKAMPKQKPKAKPKITLKQKQKVNPKPTPKPKLKQQAKAKPRPKPKPMPKEKLTPTLKPDLSAKFDITDSSGINAKTSFTLLDFVKAANELVKHYRLHFEIVVPDGECTFVHPSSKNLKGAVTVKRQCFVDEMDLFHQISKDNNDPRTICVGGTDKELIEEYISIIKFVGFKFVFTGDKNLLVNMNFDKVNSFYTKNPILKIIKAENASRNNQNQSKKGDDLNGVYNPALKSSLHFPFYSNNDKSTLDNQENKTPSVPTSAA